MDIECKAGRHFFDIDILREYSERCDTRVTLPPPHSKPVTYTCPFCLRKSLFTYPNRTYSECVNTGCLSYHAKIACRQQFLLEIQIDNSREL